MHNRILVIFIILAVAPFAWPVPSSAQVEVIPGNSLRGAALFREKGCVECHAFRGAGARVGPDLAQPNERTHTPMQLATALWNHGPRMWREQENRRIGATLNSTEAADLFAYFYSLSYFTAPGDAARGSRVFEEKACATCHEKTGEVLHRSAGSLSSRPSGPPVSSWTRVEDPLWWAERMWNHSGPVYSTLSQTGIGWPKFSTGDMVDLFAYLRALPEAASQSAIFQPGDPEQGRITFERRCESCHSFGSRTAERKIDLLKMPGPDLLTGYVAAMWNHATLMLSRAGSEFPILGPGEMSNLVAYLFAQRYFNEEGSPERGALVFESKNCVVCHELRRRQTGAPDLRLSTERYSPITISAAVWQHGRAMLKATERENLSWPEFKASEMSDLIAYLNSRLISRIADQARRIPKRR